MKATIYDIQGNKKGEIDLPSLFNTPVREDLITKHFLVERFSSMQPYSHDPKAGRKHSASGTISHLRHTWKGHYGQGRARVPRKTMWRRGTQFYWVGAEITSARGGRRVHGPKLIKRPKKLNKKETEYAFKSALAATSNKDLVLKRYSSISNSKTSLSFPIVIESNLEKIKVKDLISLLRKTLGDLFSIALKKSSIRAGKGKLRGRTHKSSAAALLIKSKDENIKMKGIEVKSTNEVLITDLYPLGRLTIYTEKALKELDQKGVKNVA